MSNSSLVSYTKISPNKTSPRNHKIDTITIHCYVGQVSVENGGDWFAKPSTAASCNYLIGTDGRVALIVDENDRSWCSSSSSNDNRAITIECASDKTHPYAINDKVYESLINLCADICKRNDIASLKWQNDKSLIGQVDKQNMTVHRWFKNKACPGEYIFSRLGQIADEVNAKLGAVSINKEPVKVETSTTKSVDEIAKEVIAGKWGNGDARKAAITNAGYDYAVVQARVNEILTGKTAPKPVTTPKPTPVPTPAKKSVDEIAQEVIAGKWGTGDARKKALGAAGYNYSEVQARVNAILGVKTASASAPAKKSIHEVAREVIQGKWGNGDARRKALTAAGYDFNAVQKRVNEML